ncbi:MAG: ribonuclease H-like domain-containing protein [Planctomycetota bacterium]|jgi:DNA polymerase elongation subunit (family B)
MKEKSGFSIDPAWPIAFDLETIANPWMVDALPEPTAKANLKDPKKIEADIAEKKAKLIDRMPLNGNTAMICAVGLTFMDEAGELISTALMLETASQEAGLLDEMWYILGQGRAGYITFNGVGFDIPMIQRRTMAQGLTAGAHIDAGKYATPPRGNHWDMMQIISNYGSMESGSLDFCCEALLGVGKYDDGSADSADVGALWMEGDKDEIAKRAARDAELTYQLWQKANGVYFTWSPR